MQAKPRPPFIISASDVAETRHTYPDSGEQLAPSRAIGKAAGLRRIGLHLERVLPGTRTSWPHAESHEEEFVFVLSGNIDAWIDGELHAMTTGDLAAFPAGTGISHTFLNNSDEDVLLLVGGQANDINNQIFYPMHPGRQKDMPWSHWWSDRPLRTLGEHAGLPEVRPAKATTKPKQAAAELSAPKREAKELSAPKRKAKELSAPKREAKEPADKASGKRSRQSPKRTSK